MKMKKIIRIVFFVFLSYLFTGCQRAEEISPVPEIKVGVLLYKKDDTFISALCGDFEKALKQKEQEKNIKITVNIEDAKGNQSIQNDSLDKFIDQGYDVICVNLVDRTAAATVIDKAKAADIPLIFFNREPVEEDLQRWEKVYYIGAAANESGILQGQIVVNQYFLDAASIDKNGDGKIQYVILEGEQGHQDALLRTEYAIKAITAAGIKVEKLANDTANWQRAQATSKMGPWIASFGEGIELVLSNNDDMALGALDAYLSADFEGPIPMIVGVDGNIEALKAVRDAQMLGTVLNDAVGQAEAMADLTYSLAFEERVEELYEFIDEKYIKLPYSIVTKENAEKVLKEIQ